MKISKRGFLKTTDATVAAGSIGISFDKPDAHAAPTKIKGATVTTTICPYCSAGCP